MCKFSTWTMFLGRLCKTWDKLQQSDAVLCFQVLWTSVIWPPFISCPHAHHTNLNSSFRLTQSQVVLSSSPLLLLLVVNAQLQKDIYPQYCLQLAEGNQSRWGDKDAWPIVAIFPVGSSMQISYIWQSWLLRVTNQSICNPIASLSVAIRP